LSPGDAQILLNWNLTKPISVIVTYREHYVNELESSEVAKVVAGLTPPEERKLVRAVYLDPSAFSDRDSPNTTAIQISKVLRENQMPGCSHADNDRKGGYSLMGMLFKATKGHGYLLGPDDKPFQANDVVFIADSCPELINSIPLLMRDPKSLEDVLKTDKTSAKIEMDSTDTYRYGMKSMLQPRKKTEQDVFNEEMDALQAKGDIATLTLHNYIREKKKSAVKVNINHMHQRLPPSWRSNIANSGDSDE
jgi:hypothetical protein